MLQLEVQNEKYHYRNDTSLRSLLILYEHL